MLLHMLQISDNQITVPTDDQIMAMRNSFRDGYHAVLPGIIEAGFLTSIVALFSDDDFTERLTPNIGCVQTLANRKFEQGMHFLLNQEPIKEAISRIIKQPVQLWVGNTVRRIPGRNHFSNWHSDMTAPVRLGEQNYRRAAPLSLNLSPRRFEGGNLEIRKLKGESLLADIPNKGFGDAILFRIARELEHRVADVQGQVPRTVHVGWFHSLV